MSLVPVRAGERTGRRGQAQLSLPNALQREQRVRESAQPVCGPAQDQDFEAVVPVEMDVGRSYNLGARVVLQVHQPMGKVGLVVAVDVGEHAHGRAGTVLQFGLSQAVAHKVADGLRAGPAGIAEKGFEAGEQFRFHRDAEPDRAGLFIVVSSVTHPEIVTPERLPVKRDEV